MCTRELGLTVVTFTSNPISAVSSDLLHSPVRFADRRRAAFPTLDSIIDTLRVLFDEVLWMLRQQLGEIIGHPTCYGVSLAYAAAFIFFVTSMLGYADRALRPVRRTPLS